jgi:predicted acetyltransferase
MSFFQKDMIIKQTFIQIKLKKEEDRNMFSFLVMEKGQLVPYRYTSIVSGFVSSPFILNYM